MDKYKNFVLVFYELMSPCLKSFKDGQKLTVLSFIPYFSKNNFKQGVGYQVLMAQAVLSQLSWDFSIGIA